MHKPPTASSSDTKYPDPLLSATILLDATLDTLSIHKRFVEKNPAAEQ